MDWQEASKRYICRASEHFAPNLKKNGTPFRLRSRWVLEPSLWVSGMLNDTSFWSYWLTWPSSSSTVVPFFSVMHAFWFAAACLLSVYRISQIFLVKCPSFPFAICLRKFCQYFFANRRPIIRTCIIFFYHCLVFVVKWHVTMPVFCHRIKNRYLQ